MQKDDGLHTIEDEDLKKLAMKVIYSFFMAILFETFIFTVCMQARNVRPDQRMYDK
jgi:hypothetical protein